MAKFILSCSFLAIVFYQASAQGGIRFTDGSLNAILSIAKDQGKNVFIDTYADWCQPCKRMKKKFRNREVGKFFNKHFVNYRVNMQNPVKANQLRKRYDIVFLPNMLIVDPNGVVKYQVDRELSIEELLNIGQKALDPNSYNISESTAIRRNSNQNVIVNKSTPKHPIQKPVEVNADLPSNTPTSPERMETTSTSTMSSSKATRRAKILERYETVDESSDKILAVLGIGELPPEVLRKEAYFRLELMDGSHKKAAKDYLATQENWDTEINKKFILDFVNNTNSPEYRFIINNIDNFNAQFGVDQVRKTLEILTYKALYNAVPRPSLEKAIELYENAGNKEASKLGHHYFIRRMISENKINEVIKLGDQYLTIEPKDHEIRFTISQYLTFRNDRTEANLEMASELMEAAVKTQPSSLIYLELLGDIYIELGINNRAKKIYKKAILEAKNQGLDYKEYEAKSVQPDG